MSLIPAGGRPGDPAQQAWSAGSVGAVRIHECCDESGDAGGDYESLRRWME